LFNIPWKCEAHDSAQPDPDGDAGDVCRSSGEIADTSARFKSENGKAKKV
jgi:hypothetical protein